MRFGILLQARRLLAAALFSVFLVSCGAGDGPEKIEDPLFAECKGCPLGGPPPANKPTTAATTPTEPAGNVISVFSDAYSDIAGADYNPAWGQTTIYSTELIVGDNTTVYTALNYQGIDFAGGAQDVSAKTTLHIDFWTFDSTLLNVYLISSGPVEAGFTLPGTQGAWVSVDIPLTSFVGVDLADVIQMKFDGNGTIYVDNIYFNGGGGGGGGGELAANGDFETGDLTGWDVASNGGTITADNTQNNGGAWSGHIVSAINNNPALKQANLAAGTVMPGDTIDISFDMCGSAANGGVVFAELFSEFAGGGATNEILNGNAPIPPQSTWTHYNFSAIAGADVAGGVSLQLGGVCGAVAGCAVDVYFDNVSITIGGGPVAGSGGGSCVTGGANAPTVAAPTPTTPAGNVTSVFSDAYTDISGVDFNPAWGQATVYTLESIAGNDTLKYAGLNYQGIDFSGNAQDVSAHDMVHLDFWTPDATAVNLFLISPGPVEAAVALPIATGNWVSVDIPLSSFTGVDLTNVVQFKLDDAATGESATIFVDNLYFYTAGAAPTTPTVAAPTPTTPAGDVTSVFSDAYTDISGVDFNPAWGQATVYTLESIAGNDTLKYAGLNYQGIDFSGNAQDVSAHDMVHLDFWTPDATAVNLFLISPGPVEAAVALPIATGNWVSVDIPLSSFTGVDLTNVVQFKLDDAATGESATIFVDNLYFYTAAAATAPTVAAPTPTTPAGNVTSVFSDAYTDITGVDFNPSWGQATVYSPESIAGNDTLKYAGLNYQGIDFAGNAQDVSSRDMLHLDFWTPDATAVNLYLISSGPVEVAVALPIATGNWVSVDIPLVNFTGVDLTDVIQFKLDDAVTGEAATIFIDNLYFYASGPPPTAPTVAAPTPTTPAGDVTSVFSDAYTDITGVDFNPAWGQATVYTLESIAGNETLKYAGLNYQGIDFSGNAQDVSGHDMVHLDFWTPDATAVNLFLISPGPVEAAAALPIATGNWVSVDIPLSSFTGVDLTNVVQFKFDDATTGESATIFIDNLYFYTSGGGGGCSPTGDNLAVNGDFETGDFSCVEQFVNGGTQAISAVNPNSGTNSANLNIATPVADTLIKFANLEPGSFSAGQTVYISFYMRGSLAPGGVVFAEFFSELSGGGTSANEILFGGGPIFPNGDPNIWTLFSTTALTGPDTSGGITLLLKGASGGGNSVDIYFDDVCISTTNGFCP